MHKLRVLVADSKPLSRNLLKSSLSYWGCEVITVEDGQQACAALQTGNIDLCILNEKLSRLSGLEVCEWIRLADLKITPHIIFLTEKDSVETIHAAYLAGASDFLIQPFRLEDVRARISVIASKVARVRSLHRELGLMDPLECYRMDLAFQSKAQSSL